MKIKFINGPKNGDYTDIPGIPSIRVIVHTIVNDDMCKWKEEYEPHEWLEFQAHMYEFRDNCYFYVNSYPKAI